MRVTMIGSGYVGLVSGACFADFGHKVTCVDLDAEKIARLKQNVMPIYEPGLAQLVENNVRAGRLDFTTDLAAAMEGAEAVFIAVGTPTRRGDGHADLTYVYAAAEDIAAHIKGFTLIVNKSTVPVGTGDAVEEIIRKKRADADFAVASNPEFLREGAAIGDFKRPDRVVVGCDDKRAKQVMRELYRPLFLNETPILFTSRRSSELIKYAANAFLATKIAFINEMADLCEKVGANVQDVSRGIGLDNRIGKKFLNAGPGYGGSCFPKDTLALVKTAEDYGAPSKIVEAVVAANDQRKINMAQKVLTALRAEIGQEDVAGKKIAVLGLTFKPNTDDMRDAPSLVIIPALVDAGVTVSGFDPEGMDEAKKHLPNIEYAAGAYECAKDSDLVLILTEWDQFRALDLADLRAKMAGRTIVDLRNIYRAEAATAAGLCHVGVGLGDHG